MKCAEARRLVQPFLDSELDARTALETEAHLEGCVECAGLFEAERGFNRHLGEALGCGGRTAALWERVEAGLPPLRRASATVRLLPAALAAAGVVLAALLWFGWQARPLDLAVAAEECHAAHARRFMTPEFTDAVPEHIAQGLGGRLDVAAFSYRPPSPEFQVEGSRLCHLGETPAAVLLGNHGTIPVSFFVFSQDELKRFPRTKRRLESGRAVVCGRAGRFQFAVRLLDGLVVCAVADTPRAQLEALLKTVERKG